jgi:hypothetical protein
MSFFPIFMSSIIRWRNGVVGRDAVVMVIAPELEVRDGKPSFMIAQAAGDLGAVVIPMACQRVRALAKLLEHIRTSYVRWDGRMVPLQGRIVLYVSPGCPNEHRTLFPARPWAWSRRRHRFVAGLPNLTGDGGSSVGWRTLT